MKITQILLLPEDADPNLFASENTLLLRKKTRKSDAFFHQDYFEYYSESKKIYAPIYLRELKKLAFPAAQEKILSIKDNPLFISRIINEIAEYKLWKRREELTREGKKELENNSFVSQEGRYINVKVNKSFTGMSMGIICRSTEVLSIEVVSDDKPMMERFAKLIKTNHDFKCFVQNEGSECMEVGDNLFKEIPTLKFSFTQDFFNGCSWWDKDKLNSIQYLLDTLEYVTNQALDSHIYFAAHVKNPALNISEVTYEKTLPEASNGDEKEEINPC